MTEKVPLDELEKRWKEEKMTANAMIDQLFIHLRDHQQWLARQQTQMLTSESRFRKLEARIKSFERWMAKARKQLAAIWDRLRGRQT